MVGYCMGGGDPGSNTEDTSLSINLGVETGEEEGQEEDDKGDSNERS